MLGANNTLFIFGKKTAKNTIHTLFACPRPERKISLMIWGCIFYHGVGTLTAVEGSINSVKYIDILENKPWPVIVWYFEDKEYLFMDGNAPVHRKLTLWKITKMQTK